MYREGPCEIRFHQAWVLISIYAKDATRNRAVRFVQCQRGRWFAEGLGHSASARDIDIGSSFAIIVIGSGIVYGIMGRPGGASSPRWD